jgi:methylphosphotriester-DNA--protein-cysteine methyltransferase
MPMIRRAVLHALLPLVILAGALIVPDKAPAQQQGVYHGNVQSHIYHRQSCRFFDCKACTAVFKSREEAEKSGYRPCRVCKP